MDAELRTVVLALAWFVAVNAAASSLSYLLARCLTPSERLHQPRLLLLIRLFPAVSSILFVVAMFLPSHWALEPRNISETLGVAWYALASAGGLLLARSAARALWVAQKGRRLRMAERQSRLTVADLHSPSSCQSPLLEVDGLPGVSLAGVVRTRILIGPAVARQLSAAELDVAVAHELAHRDALDNLARWAMLCAPDFFGGSRAVRRLEAAWHAAAESRADARAIAGDRLRAVQLASALVKVARLTAEATDAHHAPAWSTLHDAALLEWRVRRLLSATVPVAAPLRSRGLTAAAFVATVLVAVPTFAGTVHRVTETLVSLLP